MKMQNKDVKQIKNKVEKEKTIEANDLEFVKIVDVPVTKEKQELISEEYTGDIFDEELSGIVYPVEPDEEQKESQVDEKIILPPTKVEPLNEDSLTPIEEKKAEVNPPELLELVIYEEIDDMIKEDYYELQELNLEINILNEKEEDVTLKEEIKQLEYELQKLLYRFNKIANKYDHIYEKLDYDEIRNLDNTYLKGLMDDLNYQSLLDEIIKSPKDLEEYINVVNAIVEIENKKSRIKDKIDSKKEKFNLRDEEFEKLKDDYYSANQIQGYIEDYNKTQKYNLENIEKLLKEAPTIEKTIEYRQKVSFHVGNALSGNLLLAAAAFIPPTKKGNLLRVGLMVTGINRLRNTLVPTQEEVVAYHEHVTDYSNEIKNNIINATSVLKDIDNAFDDIRAIREKIKDELGEYINKIPEFKTLLININKIEKELTIQQNIAKNYSNEFDKALAQNNRKIKRLDIYN